MRGSASIPYINIEEGCNIGEFELVPEPSTDWTPEEHMIPIFNVTSTALTLVIIQNVLGMKVGSCA